MCPGVGSTIAPESNPEQGITVRAIPVIGILALLAAAPIAAAQPQGAPLGPPTDVAVVPNGDFSQGLTGWSTVGPASSMVLAPGPILSVTDNVTVVGPSVALPADAQVVPVSIGAPGSSTVVEVRARPDDGGGEVDLGTIVPTRGAVAYDIPVTAVAGRSVRLVLDPTYTIGRRIIVTGMGPVRAELPGWRVQTGAPVVGTVAGRQAIQVSDTALQATTPPIALGAGTHLLGIAVRGMGSLTARAGAAAVRVDAASSAWTWVHVPVRARATATISLVGTPAADGTLDIGPVGTAATSMGPVRVEATAGSVTLRARPAARGLRVVVRRGSTQVGAGRVRPTGIAVVAVRGSGRATVSLLGDATRAGATRTVRVP